MRLADVAVSGQGRDIVAASLRAADVFSVTERIAHR
jgi:hypothetical protein